MGKAWTLFIKVNEPKNLEVMKKCAKICTVTLDDLGDNLFKLSDPIPQKGNFNKFINSIEEREIVSFVNTRRINGSRTAIILSDEEMEEEYER